MTTHSVSALLRISAWLVFSVAMPARSEPFVLKNPVAQSGTGAIDPKGGANGGRQNITHLAAEAPPPAVLEALPGCVVLQSFPGFEGGVKSQTNRIEFSDDRPAIAFSINQSVGYGGCAAGPGEKTASTSGSEPPALGDSIYIGSDTNDVAYSISFSTPVAAAGFTISRTLPTSGPEAIWTVSFYGAGNTVQMRPLLARQTVKPGHSGNVAAYFGHIARPGTAISRIVFGKDDRSAAFVMGSENIFLDDVAFVPFRGANPTAEPVKASPERAPQAALSAEGGLARVPTGKEIGLAGGESLDLQGSNASPRSFLQQLSELRVVHDWEGFRGGKSSDREVVNFLDFEGVPDFRFRVQVQSEGNEGWGGATNEAAWCTSPGQALRIGGSSGAVRLEILACTLDAQQKVFVPDQTLHAVGFALTNVASGEVVVTYYNQSGEILALQSAKGVQDPANAGQPLRQRGAEVYFGHIAYQAGDPSQRIHRIRIDGRGEHPWGLDDFAFSVQP